MKGEHGILGRPIRFISDNPGADMAATRERFEKIAKYVAEVYEKFFDEEGIAAFVPSGGLEDPALVFLRHLEQTLQELRDTIKHWEQAELIYQTEQRKRPGGRR